MSSGWIKLHRSMFDNELWTAEPFTKGQAWIDLIGNANHKPGSTWIRGIEIHVKRGQIAWSELTMSKRWKWSRGKVRRYLGVLQNKGMAVQQTNKLTTILTICNYDVYQSCETTDSTTGRTTDSTTDGQQTDNRRTTDGTQTRSKEVKNEENKDIDIVIQYLNDRAGKKFRNGQGNAKFINARIKEGHTVEELKHVIDRKVIEWKDDATMNEYLRPQTLFNSEKFESYLNAQGDPHERHKQNGQSAIPKFQYDPDDTSWAEGFDPSEGDFENL